MHDERLARLGVTVHDVHEPVGHTGLEQRGDELLRARGRVLGRLEHDAVAREQRREALPRRDRDREVPRRDHPDDADRLARRPAHLVRQLGRHRSRPTRRARARRRSGPCRWPPARRRPPRRGSCPASRATRVENSALRVGEDRAAAVDHLGPRRRRDRAPTRAARRRPASTAASTSAARRLGERAEDLGGPGRVHAGEGRAHRRLLVAVGRAGPGLLLRILARRRARVPPPERDGQRGCERVASAMREQALEVEAAGGVAGVRAAGAGDRRRSRRAGWRRRRPAQSARPSTASDPSGPKISTSVRLGRDRGAAGDRDLAHRAALVLERAGRPSRARRRARASPTIGPSAASTRSRMCGPTSRSSAVLHPPRRSGERHRRGTRRRGSTRVRRSRRSPRPASRNSRTLRREAVGEHHHRADARVGDRRGDPLGPATSSASGFSSSSALPARAARTARSGWTVGRHRDRDRVARVEQRVERRRTSGRRARRASACGRRLGARPHAGEPRLRARRRASARDVARPRPRARQPDAAQRVALTSRVSSARTGAGAGVAGGDPDRGAGVGAHDPLGLRPVVGRVEAAVEHREHLPGPAVARELPELLARGRRVASDAPSGSSSSASTGRTALRSSAFLRDVGRAASPVFSTTSRTRHTPSPTGSAVERRAPRGAATRAGARPPTRCAARPRPP